MRLVAHGLGGVRDLPVPTWIFYWGGAVVLVASFILLGSLWKRPLLARHAEGTSVSPWLSRVVLSTGLRVAVQALSVALFVVVFIAALLGDPDPYQNLAPTLVYGVFGPGLERTWGTRFFTKYYFVTGIGAAVTSLLLSLFVNDIYYSVTVGASGAIYGLLLGYGMYFPNRPIYLYFIFPIPAKYFVMIVGAIAFFSALGGPGGGVAHTAHLGGLLVGYLYLKGLRARPMDEIKYRWLRWKMGRARSKFDVYSGGRSSDDDWKSDWKKHIH